MTGVRFAGKVINCEGGHKKICGDDGNFLCHDYSGGYSTMCICQCIKLCVCKVNFFIGKSYLNKPDCKKISLRQVFQILEISYKQIPMRLKNSLFNIQVLRGIKGIF